MRVFLYALIGLMASCGLAIWFLTRDFLAEDSLARADQGTALWFLAIIAILVFFKVEDLLETRKERGPK